MMKLTFCFYAIGAAAFQAAPIEKFQYYRIFDFLVVTIFWWSTFFWDNIFLGLKHFLGPTICGGQQFVGKTICSRNRVRALWGSKAPLGVRDILLNSVLC